jgi:hypothetical protein
MNRSMPLVRKLSLSAAIGLIAAVSAANVWAAPPQESVTVSTADLQAKADYYAKEAAYYRARAVPASKQMIVYFTMANRFDRLSKRYHLAALEASRRG